MVDGDGGNIQERSAPIRRADDLARRVGEDAGTFTEEEALAVIAHKFVTPQILARLAQIPRLTGFYSIRLALVAHRQTPQTHSTRLLHYLHWVDLLRLSLDLQVSAPVRRSVEKQLLMRVGELALGERIATARRCGAALIGALLHDPNPKVFEALLLNRRLREEELLALVGSGRATPEQLRMLAADPRWSYRYEIRKALVLNPSTPRAAAAAHVRHLSRADLRRIHSNPKTSVYLRRCIERMRPEAVEVNRPTGS